MKFLCDQMLGTLARWLRLFGFDTFYANSELDDDDLLKIAENEKRVLITRDKGLVIRSKKKNIRVIKIESVELDEQLSVVLENVEINEKAVLSRCSLCNSIVTEIKKDEVKGKVPERIFRNNERFWYCSKCDKIYWIGSHYDKIQSKLKKLKRI